MTGFEPLDAKLIIMTWLDLNLAVPVVSTRPDGVDGPSRFVRVLATGGAGRHNQVLQTRQVTIDCYAETLLRAVDLGLQVEKAMHAAPGWSRHVVSVSGTSPVELPDPDTGQRRVTATYQVTLKQ